MSTPIRIKTKTGEVIDLEETRATICRASECDDNPATQSYYRRQIAIIAALEAAVGMPELVTSIRTEKPAIAGYNAAIYDIRQAAGVIEEANHEEANHDEG
jgi:hypothetical protein